MEKVLGVVMAAIAAVMSTGCSRFDDKLATRAAATTSQVDNARSRDVSAKGVIYGIYKADGQAWFIDESEAAKKVVEQRGDELIYVDAKTNPEEYLKAIDNAVSNQTRGIVACIPDQTMSQVVMDRCKETRTPVVACDNALQNDTGGKLVPWVGVNAYVIDQANGDWLAAYAKDNNLVEDEQCGSLPLTMDTVSSYVPRVEGEYDDFTASCPDFSAERISRVDYDGTMDRGNVAAASVITAYPEIKKRLVTGANEEGTTGAVRALESAGLSEDARAVGLGAYMARDEWNDKGAEGIYMKAATYLSSDSVDKGSTEILYEVVGRKKLPLETTVDVIVVTSGSYRGVMGKATE